MSDPFTSHSLRMPPSIHTHFLLIPYSLPFPFVIKPSRPARRPGGWGPLGSILGRLSRTIACRIVFRRLHDDQESAKKHTVANTIDGSSGTLLLLSPRP